MRYIKINAVLLLLISIIIFSACGNNANTDLQAENQNISEKSENSLLEDSTPETPTSANSDNEQTEESTPEPTEELTEEPTPEPTEASPEKPTETPTPEPTKAPTEAPTAKPTAKPTEKPTEKLPPATEAPVSLPSKKIVSEWYQIFNGDDKYHESNNKFTMYDDGTFHLRVNLLAAMGDIYGTYRTDFVGFDCTVTSIDFSGFVGDDVKNFVFFDNGNVIVYEGDQIGEIDCYSIFERKGKTDPIATQSADSLQNFILGKWDNSALTSPDYLSPSCVIFYNDGTFVLFSMAGWPTPSDSCSGRYSVGRTDIITCYDESYGIEFDLWYDDGVLSWYNDFDIGEIDFGTAFVKR